MMLVVQGEGGEAKWEVEDSTKQWGHDWAPESEVTRQIDDDITNYM